MAKGIAGLCLIAALALLAQVVLHPASTPTWPPYDAASSPGSRPGAPYERQHFHLSKRLPAGQNRLPQDAYAAALKHLRRMPAGRGAKVLGGADWTWLGPGNIGGRTRALVFHPENPRTIYAAGVSGGIWKFTNGGNGWQPIADDLANINVGALAIDPANPDTLYAGTGELYRHTTRPYSSMTGAGIFRSDNGGETWRQLGPTISDDFLYVSDLVISPNQPDRFYAATNSGVWRSDDGGTTFTRILDPSDGGDVAYEGCNDLALRSDRAEDALLVSCASRSTDDRYFLPGLLPDACGGRPCAARVYLSENAGAEASFETVLTEPGMGRTQLALHAADQSIVYASSASIVAGPDADGDGFGDYDNGLHAVFRSDDGGRSWRATVRNTDPVLLNTTQFSYADGFMAEACRQQPFIYSAGWYNQAIAVSPVDPDVVWVAGMEVYRSDDGGRNWGLASYWDGFSDGVPSAYLHADVHGIYHHPDYDGESNRTLFVVNDGGVYFTDDDARPVVTGTTAPCSPRPDGVAWGSLNVNYGVTQFYTGAVNGDGTLFIGGTQDNGTLLGRSSASPNSWERILGGDGSHLALHPTNANVLYASYQNANILRSGDGGRNWVRADTGLNDRFIFIAPFVLDPNEPRRLWAGGSRLWRSDNEGVSWQSVSPSLGPRFDDLVSALAVSQGAANRVAIGNRRGIYVIDDAVGAGAVTLPQRATPREGWVSSLTFQGDDESTLYATYSTFGGQHVWRSRDDGQTWSPIDGEGAARLPDVPVHSLAIHPDDPDNLYVGTDLGVFTSGDGGATWAVESAGFAHAITETLAVSAGETPSLFAFTYGRGVWRAPLDQLDGASSYQIDGGTSGLWYNPDQGGHGLQLEVIRGARAFVSWYVYRDGEPVWFSGVGDWHGDRLEVDVQTVTRGGLPPDFDADAVERKRWGTLTIHFADDQHATLRWTTQAAGYPDGALPLVRLTSLATGGQGDGLPACYSGSWYDPAQSGHGIMLQVLADERVALTWFLNDRNGEPLWLLGQGNPAGDGAEVALSAFQGGDFPPHFDPLNVSRRAWGNLRIEREGPDRLTIAWTGVDSDASSGTLTLQRLTEIEGIACN